MARPFLTLLLAALRAHAVCIVPGEPFREIRNASAQVPSIIELFRSRAEKGCQTLPETILTLPASPTYREMSQFADRFGSRMLGSAHLEKSINKLVERFKIDHLQDVHTEDVLAVRWRREHEEPCLVRTEEHSLRLLGLGGSSGTPTGGITALLDVVNSFAELEMKGTSVRGHIVLYMPEWKGHGSYAGYLLQGTSKAARLGLTGYEKDAPRIASAVISKQDTDLLGRMVDRRQDVVVYMRMDLGEPQQVVSRNIIVEWKGSKFPKEKRSPCRSPYVLVGAHIDSWDIGQGAADNAAAVFIVWRALSTLKRLPLRPKRTVRFVVWTAREQGMKGATEFFRRYAADSGNTSMALELDLVAFAPTGPALSNVRNNDTVCIVREMLKEFETIDANGLTRGGGAPELRHWREAGVPVAGSNTAWYFHDDMRHSEANSVSGIQSGDLDLSASVVAGLLHMLGQMERKLPR